MATQRLGRFAKSAAANNNEDVDFMSDKPATPKKKAALEQLEKYTDEEILSGVKKLANEGNPTAQKALNNASLSQQSAQAFGVSNDEFLAPLNVRSISDMITDDDLKLEYLKFKDVEGYKLIYTSVEFRKGEFLGKSTESVWVKAYSPEDSTEELLIIGSGTHVVKQLKALAAKNGLPCYATLEKKPFTTPTGSVAMRWELT